MSEPPPVSPYRIPPKEEFEFGPENHPDVEVEHNQDPPRDDAFNFDPCVGMTKEYRANSWDGVRIQFEWVDSTGGMKKWIEERLGGTMEATSQK